MATSSITANFYCDDAKAANTFVDLLLSFSLAVAGFVKFYTRWNFQAWNERHDDNDGVDYDHILCVLSKVLVA